MPETHFTIVWPDGQKQVCYSPSTIVFSYLQAGTDYPLSEFMVRCRSALEQASERVKERYGFACSSAMDQLDSLEEKLRMLTEKRIEGSVHVLSLDSEAPPKKTPQHALRTSVVIIGAGQAGLSVSYLLKQEGIEHVVLEKNRLAHSWRSERWDSFCLVTPNYQCRLPGYQYEGEDPNGFMSKDEVVRFIESYAARFAPPLREKVAVEQVRKTKEGYHVETTNDSYLAEQVVVATGGYHLPRVPPFASKIPSDIFQLHSRDYKSPSQLPDGAVLVVGSGQSGCQIVEDLMLAGRRVHLSVGDAPRCARRYRGKDIVDWLELMGHYDIPIEQMPDPDTARSKTNHYVTGRDGGHDIDLRLFAQQGLYLYGSAVDFDAGCFVFAPNLVKSLDSADDTYRRINETIDRFIDEQGIDAPPGQAYEAPWAPEREAQPLDPRSENITSIVWSIGFRPSFGWLKADVFSEDGHVLHERGVTSEPGLYFLGLPWLHTWGSGRFCGVAKDAEYLVDQIRARASALTRAAI